MNLIKLVINFIKLTRKKIKKLKGRIVVFDFDGTLTEFKYAENSLLPCKDDEIYEYSKMHNIYANARMLATMQYIVHKLNPENVYILTRTEKTLIDKKNACIHKNFPTIKQDHIFHVQTSDEKLDVLHNLHKVVKVNIVFVEDTFKTILDAEEKMSYIEGDHISSYIP